MKLVNRRMMFWVFAVLCMQLLAALRMHGISSTTQVAWAGKPVVAVSDWPEGVLDLVNDPLRTDGWNPWFSEWPNDVNWYEFKIHDSDDVNRLIEKLAAIKATNVLVRLNPGKQARALAFTTVLPEKNGTAITFSIGSQAQIDAWYQRLPEIEPGVRKFGVHRYTEVPRASPPTLTLYIGHEAIDLKKLIVPSAIEVVSDITLAGKSPDESSKVIEEFIANRKSKLTNPAATRADTTAEHAAWVESCLKDFESIKVGMTRNELETKFKLDGGLQSVSPVRLSHPGCLLFKVDVEFDFKRDAADQGRAVWGKDDKVIRVSKPYLERPFMD